MATVFGGIGSFFDNLFGGGWGGKFSTPTLTSSQQQAATQAVTDLSGDGQDTFAGGTNTFASSDVVDTVIGGSNTAYVSDESIDTAGPTADGVIDVTPEADTQVITLGDDTTVQLVGVAPVDQPKSTY